MSDNSLIAFIITMSVICAGDTDLIDAVIHFLIK